MTTNTNSRIASLEKRLDAMEKYMEAVDATMAEMTMILMQYEERQKFLSGINILGKFETVKMPRSRVGNRANGNRANGNGNRANGNGNRA